MKKSTVLLLLGLAVLVIAVTAYQAMARPDEDARNSTRSSSSALIDEHTEEVAVETPVRTSSSGVTELTAVERFSSFLACQEAAAASHFFEQLRADPDSWINNERVRRDLTLQQRQAIRVTQKKAAAEARVCSGAVRTMTDEEKYIAARDAARAGDETASLCYAAGTLGLRDQSVMATDERAQEYAELAQHLFSRGFSSGDWRYVTLAMRGANGVPVWPAMLFPPDSEKLYSLLYLRRLGAAPAAIPEVVGQLEIVSQMLSQAEIASAQAEATEMYQMSFSRSPAFRGKEGGCPIL